MSMCAILCMCAYADVCAYMFGHTGGQRKCFCIGHYHIFNCEKKTHLLLSTMSALDFVWLKLSHTEYFSNLHFLSITVGKFREAVEATASYLLLNPNDTVMEKNKKIFINKFQYSEEQFIPRKVCAIIFCCKNTYRCANWMFLWGI